MPGGQRGSSLSVGLCSSEAFGFPSESGISEDHADGRKRLRRGPDEGGRRPGSRCASSGLRPCGSGGAGPWRARRVAARRLLFCLRGRETETGVRGEARERPGRVPRPGECSAAPHGASVRRPGTANSLAAFFKTRIQRLPVAGSGTPLAQSDSREGQWEHRPKGERRAPSEGVTDRR